jgi:hypothetical protein
MFPSHKPGCAGVRLAVVSNFDTRLRPLLAAMQLDSLFDAIFISAVRMAIRCPRQRACQPIACLTSAWVEHTKAPSDDSSWLHVAQEVGAEKPNPVIFELACEALDVRPEEVVHVGDDRRWAVKYSLAMCAHRAPGCTAPQHIRSLNMPPEQSLSILQGSQM